MFHLYLLIDEHNVVLIQVLMAIDDYQSLYKLVELKKVQYVEYLI